MLKTPVIHPTIMEALARSGHFAQVVIAEGNLQVGTMTGPNSSTVNQKYLPEDGIPYWDFDAPNIPNASRDVSAGAIVASALVELYGYTKNEDWLNYSKKVANTMTSSKYILPSDVDIPFVLDHSFGDWSKRSEMDEPIVYGDYYYLETLLRLKNL